MLLLSDQMNKPHDFLKKAGKERHKKQYLDPMKMTEKFLPLIILKYQRGTILQ